MRTTVTFDEDVASAVQAIRRERQMGVSEAVNELIRQGLVAPRRQGDFHQRTAAMGLRLDVANVADALEVLDGVRAR
ncbi:MAG: ribbon-helix-helix protein, CopG family [Geodermatophilaceae bacterium]|nr:ribbon-helix-helix protein, CopG family [Geodermatophilaceae bacterium]